MCCPSIDIMVWRKRLAGMPSRLPRPFLPNMLARVNDDGGETTSGGKTTSLSGQSPFAVATVLPLKEMGKTPKEWSLTLHPAHLALAESPDERPYVIVRGQVMKSATLIEGMRAFSINEPRKLTFKLSREATTTLAEWIGKPVLAACYLRRRYAWVLPVAILWILGSLPLPGDPSRNVNSLPFDPFGLVLGWSWSLPGRLPSGVRIRPCSWWTPCGSLPWQFIWCSTCSKVEAKAGSCW